VASKHQKDSERKPTTKRGRMAAWRRQVRERDRVERELLADWLRAMEGAA
jgi:hypothetical protein